MNLDWKKLGIIALFFGAVFLFGFFLYYFFFRPFFAPIGPVVTNVNQPAGQLPATININGRLYAVNANLGLPMINGNINALITRPVAGQLSSTAQGGLTQAARLTNTPTLFAVAGKDGQLLYYNPSDGKFYRLLASGAIEVISDEVFNNVSQVTWSQNRDQAILEYPDGSNIVYNFKTGKQLTLPKHWYDFSFSPTDQQIAFKSNALDPENRFLAVAKIDGSQSKVLERIDDQGDKFDVNWSPNNQMVATFTQIKDLSRSEIYFVGLNNENFKLMMVEGRDFRGQWSPTGDKLLHSVYSSRSDYKPELWIADAQSDSIGNNRKSLGLATWADKCAFSSNSKVYCAVPTTLPFGAGLNDSSAQNIADQIYKVDLNTGAKTLVAVPEGNHTIGEIIVNEDLNYLLFTDKNNNRAYRINL
ncbi:MAG: hypothetical protein A3A02_02420 [Candidatus Buchananbacteria bacterium RIFCSPLOWO2_01_FULL_39_33]|uniref:Dipeptidylpeptidase IV N-terminal domain-containing protein n=1 Tax=Candidatus Buchananbacteria bacterium RIFCSPLOWO2_01_FULL_39_33 TaxID=1797543 RepID=A0A1G1YMI1_9BACT|nr:MAG: hypothetical protein A3A02_02420 [Candidatus Buchananbacteria bacterium RIFCSPLOWO2_01_FULL_39_33]